MEQNAKLIFNQLILCLEEDNGGPFRTFPNDFPEVESALNELIQAGFFQDDPDDLEGSFWQMAAGEETERQQFFARAPGPFEVVNAKIEEIFNRA